MSKVSKFLNKWSARRSSKRAAPRARSEFAIEPMEGRVLLSVGAVFSEATGVLTVLGDNQNNSISISREASGKILINGGAISINGGTATVANTSLIQAFGQAGNDTISLSEINGALPGRISSAGPAMTRLRAAPGTISFSVRRAMTPCWAKAVLTCCSAAPATTP